MTTENEIREFLDALIPSEQKYALDYLALKKITDKKKKTAEPNRDLDLWFSEVVDALDSVLRSGDRDSPSLAVVRRLHSGSFASFSAFMTKSKLNTLTISERVSLYRMLAKMLVGYADGIAHHSGIPLSTKLVFNCIDNIPGLFDNAFPGYLASGMAPVIIRGQLNTLTKR